MSRLIALVLAAAAWLAVPVVRAEPLTDSRQVYQALEAGRYHDVEAFYAKLRRERQRAPDGQFLYEDFYRNVYWVSTDEPGAGDSWPKVDAGTRAWVTAAPHSYLAAMTRAFTLAYRARHLEVQGKWKEMDPLVSEARHLMERSRKAGAHDVLWYATRLRVASVEGLPRSDVVDLIYAGMRVDPYALRFWQEAGLALSPGGANAQDLGWLMRLAVQRTSPQEGTSMYARVLNELYWWYGDFRANPFARSGVDWELLQASFVDWKRRYPSSYPIDLHASLACSAFDKPVTAALLARIGAHPRMDVWEQTGGNGFLERCRKWTAPAASLAPRT